MLVGRSICELGSKVRDDTKRDENKLRLDKFNLPRILNSKDQTSQWQYFHHRASVLGHNSFLSQKRFF